MKERRPPVSSPVGNSKAEADSPPLGAGGRRLVIAGRILLLLVAAAALTSAIVLVRQRDRQSEVARRSFTERWICPMHPAVVSGVPGDCPICHMALVRAREATSRDEATARDVAPPGAEATPGDGAQSGIIGRAERKLVTQTIRAPAWLDMDGLVTAQVYRGDLEDVVRPRDQAVFFGTASPSAGIPIRLSPDLPTRWDASTVLVRFRTTGLALGSNGAGWVELSLRSRELLVVPVSAVLYSGEGAYVMAAPPGSHVFTRRPVEVGRILDSGYGASLQDERIGAISILSGLQEGDRVVVSDTFFLDAERRLLAARGDKPEVIR